MSEYFDRMIEEKVQLGLKIDGLNTFLSEQIEPLSEYEYTLLHDQLTSMLTYKSILDLRILNTKRV